MRQNVSSVIDMRDNSNWKTKIIWKFDGSFNYEYHIYFKDILWFIAKKSQIENAGFGLYAAQNFDKNQKIGYYEGKTIIEKGTFYDYTGFVEVHNKQPEEFVSWVKTPEGCYVMQYGNKWVDGNLSNFNGTRFMNDAYRSNFKNNVKVGTNGQFIAIKNIHEGEELFFQYSYRNTYWKH